MSQRLRVAPSGVELRSRVFMRGYTHTLSVPPWPLGNILAVVVVVSFEVSWPALVPLHGLIEEQGTAVYYISLQRSLAQAVQSL